MTTNPMGIYTNAAGTASNVGSGGTATQSGSSIDKTQFLTLLINELRNQDPTAPTDEKETLSQLAQFSSLEQMQNLNETLTSSSQFNQLSQGAALIGKTVSSGAGDSAVSGIVSSVSVQNGKTLLDVGGTYIDSSTVTGIQ